MSKHPETSSEVCNVPVRAAFDAVVDRLLQQHSSGVQTARDIPITVPGFDDHRACEEAVAESIKAVNQLAGVKVSPPALPPVPSDPSQN